MYAMPVTVEVTVACRGRAPPPAEAPLAWGLGPRAAAWCSVGPVRGRLHTTNLNFGR
jgi:hypothetical protein